MKYLMIVSSMVLGLAMPALAQDAPPAADSTKQQGTVQPPTNRSRQARAADEGSE